MTKLLNSKFDKTQNMLKHKNYKFDKTQNVTNPKCDNTQKFFSVSERKLVSLIVEECY